MTTNTTQNKENIPDIEEALNKIDKLSAIIKKTEQLVTDLKKKKLQLKEHIALGKPLPKGAHSKLASMLHSHKVNEKMKRKQRKIAKHAYDEELKRRLAKLSN